MEPSAPAAQVIRRVSFGTLLLAVVIYCVGFRSLFVAFCKPAHAAPFALFGGMWLAAFASGLVAAYALLRRSVKTWLFLLGALILNALGFLGLIGLSLMCAGV